MLRYPIQITVQRLCFTLLFAGHILVVRGENVPVELPAVPTAAAPDQSSKLLLNSNLLTSDNLGTNALPSRWQLLFNVAAKQHTEKDYNRAAKSFAALLDGNASDELKRSALIEMSVMAQEQEQLPKAQQILAQYLKHYPQDESVPEVLLRQGLLYRRMGAPALALSKFYAVMTSALTLKSGKMDYYQQMVLKAQTEIAETYYLQGKYQEASEFFTRLLKLENLQVNKLEIEFKVLKCLAASAKHPEVIANSQDFLVHYPAASQEPEARFLLASSLKQLGRNREAREQVLLLLQFQQKAPDKKQAAWTYWQQRAGNQIANQMYQEADYVDALEIYSALAALDKSPGWQLPVWYQIGLVYERLEQPEKASSTYAQITAREKELATNATPGLKAVLDMAKWRHEFIDWQTPIGRSGPSTASAKPSPAASTSQ